MKKGFNLIELMVVIAIIAILASIALPMYSGYKRRTATNNCLKMISALQQSVQGHITLIYDGGAPAGDFAAGLTYDPATAIITGQVTNRAQIAGENVIGNVGSCGALDPTAVTVGGDGATGFTIVIPNAAMTGSGCGPAADCGFEFCVLCPVVDGIPRCNTVVEALGTDDPYNIGSASLPGAANTCP